MTAKKSTSNFSTNFKYKVKSNFRIMVIIFILHLVAAPLNLINLIVYLINDQKVGENVVYSMGDFNVLYPVIGVITTCIAAAAGIIIAMNVYNYLYKKSVVDMTLSLPLTTNQRFFSDFLAGIFTYLVPFLASSIIALIINGIGSVAVSSWNYNEIGDITSSMITLIVSGFFIMLMVYVLTVLVLSCCGSMFEALAFTVIINGLIPGTIAVFGNIFFGNLYGINMEGSIMSAIERTSPVGGIIYLTDSALKDSVNVPGIKLSWLIPFIIITGIYFALSYFLYKKRKAESVSKPFVYKAFYYAMITGITFCIGTLFSIGEISVNIIPLIIITAVIYLIFEVVTNRGFKKFYMSVIRYIITIVAVIGISRIFIETECFGLVEKVPSADSVRSVEMNYNGAFNHEGGNSSSDLMTYKNINTIKSVVKMHQMIIDKYHQEMLYRNVGGIDGDVYATAATMTIKYNFKNGASLTRNYDVDFKEYVQLINVDRTDEYIDNYINSIRDSCLNSAETKKAADIYLNAQNPFFKNTTTSTKITKSMLDDFLNSLKLDMKSISDEEYYTSTKDTLAEITFNTDLFKSNKIYINYNYVNTLSVLKKYDINLPMIDMDDLYSQDSDIIIIAPEAKGIEANGRTLYYSGNDFNAKNEHYFVAQIDDELLRLLPHLKANYIATEPCYQFNINGNTFALPPQYKDLAYKVYSKAKELNINPNSDEYVKEVYTN